MKRVLVLLFLSTFALLVVAPSSSRAGDLLVTELMAANGGFLVDEDGESSDWFELFHAGNAPINTDGWFATDDLLNLTKWRFPAVLLQPGDYLLIFASGKHRVDPLGELHTNFRLRSEGEPLAIVEPDGVTISHQFSPTYPAQLPNVSYGLSQGSVVVPFVSEGTAARTLVPSSDVGTTWTQVGFNHASWTSGTTGVGYDTGNDYAALIGTDVETAMYNTNASAFVRIPFTAGDPAALDALSLRLKYDDGLVAYLNGQEVVRRNAPSTPTWNSQATAENGQPELGLTERDFDTSGTTYVLTAHGEDFPPLVRTGGPTGRYLELMRDNTGSLSNTVGFARTYGPADLVIADFDFRMPTEASHTGCCGQRADGFGFTLIDTGVYGQSGPGPSEPGVVWERPSFPSAFGVGFDIFDGTGNENTVALSWAGAEQAANLVTAFQLNNGVFNRAHIEVERSGVDSLISVTLTPDIHGTPGAPVEVFRNLRIRGMQPFDSRVAFGGRTGGAFTAVDLDNINVLFTPGSTEIAYEDIDLTDRIDLLQTGDNVLAIHGLNVAANDPDFIVLPRLEGLDIGLTQTTEKLYFVDPTPGAPNQTGYDGLVADPLISRPAGPFGSNFSLLLFSPSPEAVLRYTLDDSEPTETSPLYGGPISITSTTTVKVKGFQSGYLSSRTVKATYLKIGSSASGFDSDLPVMVIETFGRGIGQSSYTPVYAAVMDVDPASGRSELTGLADFSDEGAVKIRGSSSAGFPKKMYSFEVRDELGEDKDASILGLPAESDWVLYAPYSDKALMRNVLSYYWSNELGRYAVRTRYIELFLNTGGGLVDSNDYVGVYVLMEKIKRNNDRVDIEELLPSDNSEPEITGGYILKKDRLDPGDSGFTTSRGQTLAYVEPKEDEITSAQATWIRNYMNQFEAALHGPNFADPDLGYARYIDVDSFIDQHILVETMKNIDGYRLSAFMYKDRGGKLVMGPAWDYNLSLGNANYLEGWLTNGWYYPLINSNQYPWYPRLFQDPNFKQRYIDRWTAFRRGAFQLDSMLATVDADAAILAESQVRNFQKWNILGEYVWPNWYVANTWQQELNWMKGWITGRVAWIDSNWLTAPAFNQDGGAIDPGFVLSMTAPVGTVYYTMDGNDPRLPGGGVSPTALSSGSSAQVTLVSEAITPEVRVLVPTNGTLGQSWTSISFNDSGWTRGTTGLGVGYEQGTGYDPYIDVNVAAEMQGRTSVYMRYRFQVDDPSALDFLTLRMMYDDGFAAYLNGQPQPVTSANAPASPAWDSPATAQHDDGQAVIFQDFNLPGGAEYLVAGTNVLAIHGLNASPTSSDLLFVPELVASSSAAGDPIVLTDTTFIRARAQIGSDWSGLSEEVFALDYDLPLRITEMHYHPPLPTDSPYGRENYEFVELQNIGASTIRLAGVRFTDGIDFDFTLGAVQSLGPGQIVLVVKNLEAFSWLYDTTGMNIAGEYGTTDANNFANNGELVTLIDGRDQVIHSFTYLDTWHPETDGGGYSLTILDSTAPLESWASPDSWVPSSVQGGTPGEEDSDNPDLGGRQLPADANQDSVVSISDAVRMLRILYAGASLPCEGGDLQSGGNLLLLDLEGDGGVDVSDTIYLLTYLFQSGPPPILGTNCVRILDCPNRCGF